MKRSVELTRLVQWYEQRSLRERGVLLVCFLVLLLFVWNLVLLEPLDKRKKEVRQQANKVHLDLETLKIRESAVLARKGVDPDRENRLALEQLRGKIDSVRQQLEKSIDNLVSPQEMPALLERLLKEQKKLKLVRLENLPAEPLQLGAQQDDATEQALLYRHRLQLEFVGDYLATLDYLKKIESLPRRLVWEDVVIETEAYPKARVQLQVYTLSMDKGWIGG